MKEGEEKLSKSDCKKHNKVNLPQLVQKRSKKRRKVEKRNEADNDKMKTKENNKI